MTSLGRGQASQVNGKPTNLSRSPATITLGTTIVSTNINSVGGANLTEGQNTMANSLPVAIASDQSSLPISITFPSNIYKHINSISSTTVKASAGTLIAIIINTKGTTSNTITVLDGANTIAVIDSTSQLGTFSFNCAFITSLIVTIASGTAPDITVVYQ